MGDDSAITSLPRSKTHKMILAMILTITAFVFPTAIASPGAQASQSLAAFTTWVNNHVGQHVGGNECVNLVNTYGTWAGAQSISGDAVNFYTNSAGKGWSRWLLGQHTPARADVAIYNSGLSGRAAGHVAVILENVSASEFRVFHQNWPSGATAVKGSLTRVPATMEGYIRPPVS
jgi:hypothetical protein